MARTSNNGGDLRTGESKAPKAPAKTPARRRSDKPRPAVASDSMSASAAAVQTASVPGLMGRASSSGPSEVDVARLAYELYVERGYCDGYDKEDWYEAERRLREQR